MIAEAIKKIEDLAHAKLAVQTFGAGASIVVLEPSGRVCKEATEALRQSLADPDDNRITDQLATIAALAMYSQRHADASRSCCYIGASTITLVVDDGRMIGDELGPAWRRHRAVMPLERNIAWARWNAPVRRTVDEFERFIAANRSHFAHPDVARALSASIRSLEWTSENATNYKRTASGSILTVTNSDKVAELPEDVLLQVPVFAASNRTYNLEVVLRPCRLNKTVAIETIPIDCDRILAEARADLAGDLAETLAGVLVIEGSPGDQQAL